MLPGLAEQADGGFGRAAVGLAGAQGGDSGRLLGVGGADVGRGRGVPRGGRDILQAGEHVDAEAGDRLEGTVRAPDVSQARVQAPADTARRLGGGRDQELALGPGQGGGRVLGEQHGRGGLEGDDADPPGQVQVQLAGDLQARESRFGQEHHQAGLGHRRDHHDARDVGRDDVPPPAGQPPASGPVVGPDAAGLPVAGFVGGRHGPGHRPGGQLGKPPFAGLTVTGGQQRPGRHRAGQERPGVQGPAEFDVDRAGLHLGLAEPAELLRDRPARQAQLARQPGVQARRVAGLAVQRAAQLGPGQLAGEDGAQGVMAGVLVFAEVDRIPNRHESRFR